MLQLVIFTGRSGSGKTAALHNLEDSGYYCVDNMPLELLLSLINTMQGKADKVAVTLDIRNLTSPSENQVSTYLETLRNKVSLRVVYLDSTNTALLKRFSESRRIHPLSLQNSELSLEEAIKDEENQLDSIKQQSDLILDTTGLSIHQLNDLVHSEILGTKAKQLKLVFTSFGFKHGLPQDADYVFDARFLPNPHWVPELRPLTGLDQPVIDYLAQSPEVSEFIWQVKIFLKTWLPALERNNRSYVTVAIGCTGGQHRSVYVAQTLADAFKQERDNITILHREQRR
ncbi:RNase adapter RapZ [Saccharobesus litoralis]|uniref:RNase adapter RapZ n=1 Tax=Saccharobesus litoralis TaxID=2172099 RepID=A0A2S0VWQ4_9ALTE|nr:RNase adapter RapZ [Saccharobesus litoralis]AWB68654.1 RNase adapter RapZ [Saccharobesus litoralis]